MLSQGNAVGTNDFDSDYLPDEFENTSGIQWNMTRTFPDPNQANGFYLLGDDREIFCEIWALNLIVNAANDWAFLGQQFH